MTIYRHLLIDWLTLRVSLDDRRLSRVVHDRVLSCLGRIQCFDANGAMLWQKNTLDIDKLRSDTPGLVWQVQSDGKSQFLAIAASPASLRNAGLNVFGDLDVRSAAETLRRVACRALRCVLPPIEAFQCRRIDITGNYCLPDVESVKQALRQLLVSDGARRRPTSAKGGGDTVAWNATSDISKGKAYHKGYQVRFLVKKGKLECAESTMKMLDRLLRLEHTKGARWFRRLEEAGKHWYRLTAWELWNEYREFFGKLVNGVEVNEMDRDKLVEKVMKRNAISHGRATAAFNTLRNIKEDGFEVVKGYMPESTFYLHLKYLRRAGVTDADMTTAKVLDIRPVRIVLAEPVGTWEDLRRVA